MNKFLRYFNINNIFLFSLCFMIAGIFLFSRGIKYIYIDIGFIKIYFIEIFLIIFSFLSVFKCFKNKEIIKKIPYKKQFILLTILFFLSFYKGWLLYDDKIFVIRHASIFYYAFFTVFINIFIVNISKLKYIFFIMVIFAVFNFLYGAPYAYFYSSIALIIILCKGFYFKKNFLKWGLTFLTSFFFFYVIFFQTQSRSSWIGNIVALLAFFVLIFFMGSGLHIRKRFIFLPLSLMLLLFLLLSFFVSKNKFLSSFLEAKTFISFSQVKKGKVDEIKKYKRKIFNTLSSSENIELPSEITMPSFNYSLEGGIDYDILLFLDQQEQKIKEHKSKVIKFYKELDKDIDSQKYLFNAKNEKYFKRYHNFRVANIYWRLYTWEFYLKEVMKSPILGYGFGRKYYPEFLEYNNILKNRGVLPDDVIWGGDWSKDGWQDPHNSFIYILFMTGFVGFGVYCWFLYLIFKDAILMLNKPISFELKIYILIIILSLVYILVNAFFMPGLICPYFSSIFWIMIGLFFVIKNGVES
ncbi:MAG: hypothetical protein GY817_05935 [bacterium]|nr:hypothetical protein [bacterium]